MLDTRRPDDYSEEEDRRGDRWLQWGGQVEAGDRGGSRTQWRGDQLRRTAGRHIHRSTVGPTRVHPPSRSWTSPEVYE